MTPSGIAGPPVPSTMVAPYHRVGAVLQQRCPPGDFLEIGDAVRGRALNEVDQRRLEILAHRFEAHTPARVNSPRPARLVRRATRSRVPRRLQSIA
jgi:hypothetical protein